jgi:hypothetical protein
LLLSLGVFPRVVPSLPSEYRRIFRHQVLAVVVILVPQLLRNTEAIAQRWQQGRSGERGGGSDVSTERLFTLRGSTHAALFQIKTAVVQAAARPRGADCAIVQGSPVVARMFPGNPVFMLNAFRSPEFDAVIQLVRSESAFAVSGHKPLCVALFT